MKKQKCLFLALEKVLRKEAMILQSSGMISFANVICNSARNYVCIYTHSQGEKVQHRSLALDVIMP